MSFLRRVFKRVTGSLFLALVAVVGAPVAAGATVLAGFILLPLPASIPLPKPNPLIEPTIIYDRYGHPIASLAQNDSNIPVTESQIPAVVKEAVVADEDRNYYHEGGVDLRGTLRAAWEDLTHHAIVQGGSTIVQQYVKLAYTNEKRTFFRKIYEAILASQLNREASKNDILYHYLTIVYFGDGNYGIGAAAENYFHVPVQDLDASQAATLAGLIPAPSVRAPRQNLAAAEAAREVVLGKMLQQHYLTEAQYRAAMAQRLWLAASGPAPANDTVVYPQQSIQTSYPDFVDYVTRWLLQYFPASEVYGGGLRVQTTLDPAVQNAAYAAVQSTLSGTSEPLEMALAAVQPQTGFVEAIVGGRQFGQGPYADDNFAIGGCDPEPAKGAIIAVSATCWSGSTILGGTDGRQPGSAWKPFVLATAFEEGIGPGTVYNAPGVLPIPGCTSGACVVHNDEPDQVLGNVTLAQATWDSINTVYAQVAPQVGCPKVAATAKALGIDSAYWSTPPFYYCQTYALGEVDVSPLDMASAYGVFADHGLRAVPTPVLEVVSSTGKVLINNIKPLPKAFRVLPAAIADDVTNVLEGVISQGTGTAAQLGRPAAGKTGTTNNYTNAWFVGYTPELSTAVWMGEANSQSETIGGGYGVKGYNPVYGGTWPAITWREFMSQALAGVPPTGFAQAVPLNAPSEAPALIGPTTTTTTTLPPIEPGPAMTPASTPVGGPYNVPPAPPVVQAPTSPAGGAVGSGSAATTPGGAGATTTTPANAGSVATTSPSGGPTITAPAGSSP